MASVPEFARNFSNWIIYVTVKAAQFEYEIGYILVTE